MALEVYSAGTRDGCGPYARRERGNAPIWWTSWLLDRFRETQGWCILVASRLYAWPLWRNPRKRGPNGLHVTSARAFERQIHSENMIKTV